MVESVKMSPRETLANTSADHLISMGTPLIRDIGDSTERLRIERTPYTVGRDSPTALANLISEPDFHIQPVGRRRLTTQMRSARAGTPVGHDAQACPEGVSAAGGGGNRKGKKGAFMHFFHFAIRRFISRRGEGGGNEMNRQVSAFGASMADRREQKATTRRSELTTLAVLAS
jgi:hypothetical protein